MKNNQNGFAYVATLLIAGVISIIGFTGYHVWDSKYKTTSAVDSAAQNHVKRTSGKKKPADQPTNTRTKNIPATVPPSSAQQTSKTGSAAPAQTTHTTAAPAPSPTPVPSPTPQPIVYTPSLTLSSDGCSVTAYGSADFTLYIEAHNASKGGESTYVLPASSTLTEQTGGIQGMSVDAILKDRSGANLVERTGTITAPSCF